MKRSKQIPIVIGERKFRLFKKNEEEKALS